MIALKQRTAEEGIAHHAADPVRVYANDPVQGYRIRRSVEMAQDALSSLGRRNHTVWELGCGTGDISGQLAWACNVYGFDCNEASIAKARERWSRHHALYDYAIIEKLEPVKGDLLILCEILEHIERPVELVQRWLPKFKSVLISHPIDGDVAGDNSGGDHCWSYSADDFYNWFKIGGHDVQSSLMFPSGAYKIALGWGRNNL